MAARRHGETFRGRSGKWYWRVVAGNGEKTAQSQGYTRRADAARGLRREFPGILVKALSLLVALVLTSGCASLRPVADAAVPVNPALPVEGRLAQAATRIVDAIGIAQAGLPTLARTGVLTADEALTVNGTFRDMIQIAGRLGEALRVIDTGRNLVDIARQWDTVAATVSELLRSTFSIGTPVATAVGRTAVAGLLGKVGDHLGELLAVAPDVTRSRVQDDFGAFMGATR